MGDNKLKKMIVGEEIPDRDDPKYRKRYEEDVEAGRRFARFLKLDVLAGHVELFAQKHRRLFLAIVFGIILFCFGLNVHRFSRAYRARQEHPGAVRSQEEVLRGRIPENTHTMIPIPQEDGTDKEN
ncbi:MAG: hypothetical protein II855_06090 [Candidatus Methanomethylophilaceae archaeon]|nr:hypothetical protein [Candidatus Methanomethylophilaceae archaeon]MBQ6177685.1 hypothetical protein [Bacteroidales bacterium]